MFPGFLSPPPAHSISERGEGISFLQRKKRSSPLKEKISDSRLDMLSGFQFPRFRETEVLKILSNMKLDDLSLVWASLNEEYVVDIELENDVKEFEFFQPPSTVKSIAVQGWKGVKFPQSVRDWFFNLANNLVSLHITDCHRCQHLPSFSSLCSLQSLQLWGLNALEWIENSEDIRKPSSSATEYFPSLKYLLLANLTQLKGWSMVEVHDGDFERQKHENQLYLPKKILNCLSELRISGCPNLMSMPLVPSLEILEAIDIHEKLLKHLLSTQESPTSSSSAPSASPTLKKLHINFVHELEYLSIVITSLQVLTVKECKELINVLIGSSNSIRRLKVRACPRLKDISQALHHLSTLEELEIESCEELNWACMMDDIDKIGDDCARTPKLGLNYLHSLTVTNIFKSEPLPRDLSYFRILKELSLCWLYNMRVLPESIGCLTQLCRLVIRYSPKLKKLPESFPNLKSLIKLEIKDCPKLVRRCKLLNGEDCNLVKDIPNVHLG